MKTSPLDRWLQRAAVGLLVATMAALVGTGVALVVQRPPDVASVATAGR